MASSVQCPGLAPDWATWLCGGERRTQARPCPSSEGSLAPTLVLAARTCEALCSKAQTLFRPTLPGSQQTLQEDPGLQNGLAVLWRGDTEEMQGASLPKVLEPAEKEGPERRSSRHLPGVGVGQGMSKRGLKVQSSIIRCINPGHVMCSTVIYLTIL